MGGRISQFSSFFEIEETAINLDGTSVLNEQNISLGSFKDAKLILVVNTASLGGLSDQNFEELNILYEKYKGCGLEIIAFPSNFAGQEFNDNLKTLKHIREKKKAIFPVMKTGKKLNGKSQPEVYKFMKHHKNMTSILKFNNKIKWNYTKFLIYQGQPVRRYGPFTNPLYFESDIDYILQNDRLPIKWTKKQEEVPENQRARCTLPPESDDEE